MHTFLRRATVIGGAGLLGLSFAAVAAAPASAHVRVDPGEAPAGGYTVLTFRVPNESDTAATTRVEVSLPRDEPFTSVSVEPVAGWTATVTTAPLDEPATVHGATVTEAPASIVWTADEESTAIQPGEFRRFSVSAGPVPDVDRLLLPATQTYSDGTVVAWDQETPESGAEPERPAPVLHVTDAAGQDAVGAVGADGSPGMWLGAAGLGLGLVGAATGVAALARVRSSRPAVR